MMISANFPAASSLLLLGWLATSARGFPLSNTVVSPRQKGLVFERLRLQATKGASDSHEETNTNQDQDNASASISRRSAMVQAAMAFTTTAAVPFLGTTCASASQPNGLILQTAPKSGLRWADARVGSGVIPEAGSVVTIDYSMASTAGRFPTIYSTQKSDEPYRWKLGDGTTIRGIELAVTGEASEGIPPMQPGGIRRVIVPNALGYNALIDRDDANNKILDAEEMSPSSKNQRCLANAEGSLGPIPPKDAPDGAYQRWYQFYCNPRIPYQPDLVLDIKLYGKR